MKESLKILGQVMPAAVTSTALYTVPTGKSASVSSIMICSTVQDVTVRVSVAIAGESLSTKQYIYYDLPITASDTFVATVGISLSAGDVVRVYTSAPYVTFNMFGVEVT
jgi:hypothetical protein